MVEVNEILSFDDVHMKVEEFGGELNLGAGVVEAVVRDGVAAGNAKIPQWLHW